MKWAFENKDYYMAYILYTEYNIGIPNVLLYSLPSRSTYASVNDFITHHESKYTDDEYLNKIFVLFKSSKYKKLSDWDNRFGYIIE